MKVRRQESGGTMSKRFFALITFTSLVISVEAQTWDEWFKQKETKKLRLVEQIAALQVYSGYLEKGFSIAKEGWQTVASFKDGTFSLHDDFIGRLAKINPELENSHRLVRMIEDHYRLLKLLRKAKQSIAGSDSYQQAEKDWLIDVINRSIQEALLLTSEIQLLLSDDELDLSDNERMQRLMGIVDRSQH